jgi:tRNA modification GTPase
MIFGDRDSDTICAVSTPPGVGGISVIRLSGASSIEIVQKIACFIPREPESHRVFYGFLKNPLDLDRKIDEVLLSYFKEGKSFTGEKVVEISCHGNPLICDQILKTLVYLGARIAEPGEFTYRAFMNGRVDLIQAESILSLVEGQSKKATEIALQQLKGGVSADLIQIEDSLIWLLANLEASIDFSTEDIEVLDKEIVLQKMLNVERAISYLTESYRTGKKLVSGLHVTLVGPPNVGKSSLLNNLLKEERAIVSDIPGTTRDVIKDQIMIGGTLISFSDTAGLRDTDDKIESIGVQKSIELFNNSDLIFFVVDGQKVEFGSFLEIIKNNIARIVFLVNKSDLLTQNEKDGVTNLFNIYSSSPVYFVSAFDKACSEILKEIVKVKLIPQNFGHTAVLSQARHFDNLSRALNCVQRAIDLMKSSASVEFVTLELKDALMRVQETLGKRYDDEVLDRIFKEFCIGK